MTLTKEQIERQIWAWKIVDRLLAQCAEIATSEPSGSIAHDVSKIELAEFRASMKPLMQLALAGLASEAQLAEATGKALDEAAIWHQEEAAKLRTLLDRGKGEYGTASYVPDATWHSWISRVNAHEQAVSAILALKEGKP